MSKIIGATVGTPFNPDNLGGNSNGINLITKFDGIDANYEENQVYNANAVNQVMAMYAEIVTEIQEALGTLGEDYTQAISLIGGAE